MPPTYPVVTSPGPVGDGDELRFRPWSDSRAGGILFVLTHPDDETFLCGGTIARYAAAGIPVHCLCATRGESGTIAPEIRRDRPVAAVRLAELAGAAQALGLDAVSFLGYRDSGMPGSPDAGHPEALINASLAECSERIALLIRALRPRIVVTHGPYGEYGHPDHIRLHEATLLAFRLAGDKAALPESAPWSPDALFVTVFDTRLVRFAVRVLRLLRRDPRRVGEHADVDLVAIADNAPSATCVVDVGRWLATRDRATRHHRSQLGERRYLLMLPRVVRRWFRPTESYARVIPPHQADEPLQRDLIRASRSSRSGTAGASSARLVLQRPLLSAQDVGEVSMYADQYLDVTAVLAGIALRGDSSPFGGRWENKHPMNTPGPLYTSGSDKSGNGPLEAPNNVLCDAVGDDVVFRQPVNRLEVRQMYGAASADSFSSYGMDGDSRWSLQAIREWWTYCQELAQEIERLYEVQRGLKYPQRDVFFYVGLVRWRDYFRHEMHPYLRAYAFFLEMGRFPDGRAPLPEV